MGYNKSINRFIGGKRAQKNGRNFEDMIKEQCKLNQIKCLQSFVPTILSRGKLIYKAKGGPDFTILYKGKAIFFDAKSFDSDRITYSQLHQHQINELNDISNSGFKSGYLVWMREISKICWIDISKLVSLESGKSIKSGDLLCIGQSVSPMLEPSMDFFKLFEG